MIVCARLIAEDRIELLKGDIYSIGGVFGNINAEYTGKTITPPKGASLFLFTDGFIDQFGGDKTVSLLLPVLKRCCYLFII